MSRLVCLFFLLAASVTALPGRAQGQPGHFPGDSAAQAARDDTAVAVQRLFRLQRHASVPSLLLGTIVAASSTYSLATYHPETTYQRVSTVGFVAVSGYGWYLLVTGAMQRWRFRARQEEALLGQLDQGLALPGWVRRRLTPAYFGAQRRTN